MLNSVSTRITRKRNWGESFSSVSGKNDNAFRRVIPTETNEAKARIAVLVDELFALCCRKVPDEEELDVECGVAPDAQSVTIRITGSFEGKDPLEENDGPALQSADYIQNHGDYISFKPGEEQDSISVVCFL